MHESNALDFRMMRRALVVGINEYAFEPLSLCVRDAEDMAQVLEMRDFNFEVRCLLDFDASRRTLLDGLAWLRDPELDLACLYLSGHGWATSHGTFFVTADGVAGDEGIDVRSIPGLLGAPGTGATQRLMLYDFCHSGFATARNTKPGITHASLTTKQLRDAVSASDLGAAAAVIAACRDDQLAYEYSALQHGKLTYHLLDGLLGNAIVADAITAHGLYDYVCRGFGDDPQQRPVWRGDVDGPLVLASFAKTQGGAQETTPASPDAIHAVEAQARAHLEDYHRRWSVSLQEWQDSGWVAAAAALQELLRWFERQLASRPEVSRSAEFARYHQAARGRLSQLANVDLGTLTARGKLTDRVGAGAFGSVWRVREEEQDGSVADLAYKIYHPGDLHLSDKLSRFERGFRAMQQLNHDHVVRVHQYTPAPVGFFMDYIDGPNLRALSPVSSMTAEDRVQLLLTVADAIAHAHDAGVIHRDIKPENIVTRYDTSQGLWFPYLTDFDLAWFSTATQVTKEGFGAQFYSAPEQFARPNSPESHGKTVDVYAFGQLLFFIIVGTDPQPLGMGENDSVLASHLSRWSASSAAELLLELFRACTTYDWRDRTQDFTTVGNVLNRALLSMRLSDGIMSMDLFARELMFALGGIGGGGIARVTTRSGRSEVALADLRESSSQRTVSGTVTVSRLTRILMPGAGNYAEARVRLVKRIDTAMRNVNQSHVRRQGGDGVNEIKVSIKDVPLTRDGVADVAAAITQLLGAFEAA